MSQWYAMSIALRLECALAIEILMGVSGGRPVGFLMGHITGVAHITFGGRSLYAKEVMCIYHVNHQFGVYLSVSVRSLKVTAYSFSGAFKNFRLLTPAVHHAMHDTIVYYARQCHFIWSMKWTYNSRIWIKYRLS